LSSAVSSYSLDSARIFNWTTSLGEYTTSLTINTALVETALCSAAIIAGNVETSQLSAFTAAHCLALGSRFYLASKGDKQEQSE